MYPRSSTSSRSPTGARLSSWPGTPAWAAPARPAKPAELIKDEFLTERRLRQLELELPTADQADRYVRSALFKVGQMLAGRVAGRLTPETAGRRLALIGVGDGLGEDEDPDLLRMIESSPGAVSLSTMLAEIGKLAAIASLSLPGGLFADVAPVLKEWRDQAMIESPSHVRDHSGEHWNGQSR